MSTTWNAAIARVNAANRDLFGTTVTWTHGSLSEDVTVVIYSPSAKEESVASPNYLLVWALAADVSGIARGDTLLSGATLYRVKDVDPDGGGGINITLEKTAS